MGRTRLGSRAILASNVLAIHCPLRLSHTAISVMCHLHHIYKRIVPFFAALFFAALFFAALVDALRQQALWLPNPSLGSSSRCAKVSHLVCLDLTHEVYITLR